MDPDARGRNMQTREEIELPVDILVVAQAIGEVDPARSDELRGIADAVGALMRASASSCPGRRAVAEADELRAALAMAKAEMERLRTGIREHRDQRGDDRCWVDDLMLYRLLPEGEADWEDALPPKDEFLRSCERYWRQRQSHVGAPDGCMTIRQLEADVARLEAERDRLIEGCIQETWRLPRRTMANVDDSGVYEHGWEWRFGATGDFVATRALAVAAVRAAAGLDGGGGCHAE